MTEHKWDDVKTKGKLSPVEVASVEAQADEETKEATGMEHPTVRKWDAWFIEEWAVEHGTYESMDLVDDVRAMMHAAYVAGGNQVARMAADVAKDAKDGAAASRLIKRLLPEWEIPDAPTEYPQRERRREEWEERQKRNAEPSPFITGRK